MQLSADTSSFYASNGYIKARLLCSIESYLEQRFSEFLELCSGQYRKLLDARPPGMRTVAGSILTSGKTFMLSWKFGNDKISTAIPSFPLIQELAKECASSTGKLPRRLVQEQCGYVN